MVTCAALIQSIEAYVCRQKIGRSMKYFGLTIAVIIAKTVAGPWCWGHGYFSFSFAFLSPIDTNYEEPTLIKLILQSGGCTCCWGLCTFCACGRVKVLSRYWTSLHIACIRETLTCYFMLLLTAESKFCPGATNSISQFANLSSMSCFPKRKIHYILKLNMYSLSSATGLVKLGEVALGLITHLLLLNYGME